jgi:lipopolysaccharide/colanic/teichoic acid biosynthesis glycosyltransferase
MRKHKLDEIPNFINVLKGEMSLVGPRPEQQFFIEQIVVTNPEYKILQGIKPGITSWGQVKYGYAASVSEMIERLKYDIFYYQNKSLWFDIKILLYTTRIIFKGEGV